MGDIVLLVIDHAGTVRPLVVTATPDLEVTRADGARPAKVERRVNGTILCEPEDHTAPLFRGWAEGPARVLGRPDRLLPIGYGEGLGRGTQLGQWRTR